MITIPEDADEVLAEPSEKLPRAVKMLLKVLGSGMSGFSNPVQVGN